MLPKPTNIAFRVCPSRYKALAALANQMDITRYTNVGSAPSKTNYSPTSYSAQYMSNPVQGNSTSDNIVFDVPLNTFSAYTAGLHTE